MTDEARVLRQNDVCKTLITIDLAVVAATVAIVGSSKPISFGLGAGAVVLTIASIAFVVSMVDLINTPDTNRWLSRGAFIGGLGLSLIGFVLLITFVALASGADETSAITLEAGSNGMSVRIPRLCNSIVRANTNGAIVKIAPPSASQPSAKPNSDSCVKAWRVEADLGPGKQMTLTPLSN